MTVRALARRSWPWLLAAVAVTALLSWLPVLPSLAPLVTLEGFKDLAEPRLLRVLLRTLWIAGAAAGVAVLLGGPLALLAGRTDLPGARLFGLLLPLPLFLPPLLVAAGWHGLTGLDGPWAAAFTLGACYAPFPALLVARALARQEPAAHEAAVLAGGRRMALGEMARTAAPSAALGGALAFLFASSDFAVPDYFSSVGETFDVYANVVFNAWRSWTTNQAAAAAARSSLEAGTAAAGPLVLLAGLVFLGALVLRDRLGMPERSEDRIPPRLSLGRARWPLILPALAAAGLLLLLPLGRIVYETGTAGPDAPGTWGGRSLAAFQQGLERGRADLGRSLATGAMAAVMVALVAPFWARLLVGMRTGWPARLLAVALALPLLAPAVGIGIGAITVFNRDLFGSLYESRLLPAMVMAGRFLPVAVFLLAERFQRVPPEQEEAALLAGVAYPLRVFRYRMGPQRGAWLLAAGLVAIFAVREIDLAVLLPAANASAAVRYYNALHFARDNFVAAFGLIIALVLFLPVTLSAAWQALREGRQ